MLRFGCKAIGLAALTFCTGLICGWLFPLYVVAVIDTVFILFIAYLCLCKF